MDDYSQNLKEEKEYLDNTILLLKYLIKTESDRLIRCKEELISSRKDMWENSVHFSNDFERLTEMNQYLQQLQSRTFDYENTKKNIEKYSGMLDSPYFGRFDFTEEGTKEIEKIYIGKNTVTDSKTRNIVVYDWRAPISSMYYRFEPGNASFKAPFGEITGEITLKRHYKIVQSQLKYYFDCSIQINDEILQEVLSQNSSAKMRTIIETIQKEQDIIIRDTDNDLLIVQGVAGSGKTSIALHRIAFLLYEGISSNLTSNNILILSPNDAFTNYIWHVLPELGEKNVVGTTMEYIVKKCVGQELLNDNIIEFEGRNAQLEGCISGRVNTNSNDVSQLVQFKGSNTFKQIIDRYIRLYEHKLLKFEDVYYNGRLIINKDELKSMFLDNKTNISIAKRLERIKSRIMDAIVDLRKERLKKLETIVQKNSGHKFEIRSFARLLLIKDSKTFVEKLEKFTEINIFSIYKGLFKNKERFHKLAKGLTLPENIDKIIEYTYAIMENKCPHYEDITAIAYIKIKTFGKDLNKVIKQVVIDEVQDYYPLQLAIIKELYGESKFTVVGDFAQSIEKICNLSIYDYIPELLEKRRTIRLSLNKSYRSSYEINEFTKNINTKKVESLSFPRHEETPEILFRDDKEAILNVMIERIQKYLSDGLETVVILCKTMKQTEELNKKLSSKIDIRPIINASTIEINNGCSIMPIYFAKGLEFDAVLIYEVDDANYSTELDGRLLYIACTRALHRLSIYYTGNKSKFLEDADNYIKSTNQLP